MRALYKQVKTFQAISPEALDKEVNGELESRPFPADLGFSVESAAMTLPTVHYVASYDGDGILYTAMVEYLAAKEDDR